MFYRPNNRVETDIVHNPLTLKFESISLKHISEMFNDVFGEVLWKGLIEDNSPDPGEIQATRSGNFQMKCRLLRIFNFFRKCRILLFLGTHTKYRKIFKSALIMKLLESLRRYIL